MKDSRPTKPKLRWYQYSLRSLLIVMTVFAIWFGPHMDRARKQKRAVEVFREIGGEVRYENHFQHQANVTRFDKGKPSTPKWLGKIVGVDFFDSVRTVYLYDKVRDEHLAHLKSVPEVESLMAGGPNVTDSGVAHLLDLHILKELSLGSDKVTDAGVAHIASLEELRYLHLGCSFTDEGLEQLATLKKLEKLLISRGSGLNAVTTRTVYAMEDTSDFEYVETPLKEVVKYLSELHNLPFNLDTQAIQAAGISPEVSVTAAGKNVPLEDGLDEILDPIGLGWVVTPMGLVITTREVANKKKSGFNHLKKSLPNLKEGHIIVDWP